jgi:hypothetical protein
MLSSVDAIGKIQQIYRAGTRSVPYATFMNVFNSLLSDEVRVVPRDPSDDLRAKLRAACMAVNAGISDPEGRGEQRVREFREKILPVWKAWLPESEFAEFAGLLAGRRLRKAKPKEGGQAAAETVEAPVATEKSAGLLRRLGLAGRPAPAKAPGAEATERAATAAPKAARERAAGAGEEKAERPTEMIEESAVPKVQVPTKGKAAPARPAPTARTPEAAEAGTRERPTELVDDELPVVARTPTKRRAAVPTAGGRPAGERAEPPTLVAYWPGLAS